MPELKPVRLLGHRAWQRWRQLELEEWGRALAVRRWEAPAHEQERVVARAVVASAPTPDRRLQQESAPPRVRAFRS